MTQSIKPMRILLSAYACEPNKGSEPGVGWNWALALVRRGHEVWVLTRKNNQAPIEVELLKLGEPYQSKLHFIYYDLPRWAAWWKKGGRGVHLYYALWQRAILNVAKEQHAVCNFDLAHHLTFGVWRQPSKLYKLGIPLIFGPVGGGETAPYALVKGLPTYKAKLNELVRYALNALSLLNPVLRMCLQKSTLIIAKTPETSALIKKAGASSMVSLEIGIDAKRVIETQKVQGNSCLRCLYAGRLIGWKGVHLAIQAIKYSRDRNVDTTLTIVGTGSLEGALKKLCWRLGVQDSVHFMGQLNQSELFKLYHQHDVLLFPSLHDSSGNVILEAFAHSLPVICLRLGGPGVLVDDACGRAIDTSGLTQEEVVTKLSMTLVGIAKHPELLMALQRGAKTRATHVTWDNVVEGTYGKVELISYSNALQLQEHGK